MRLVGLAGLVLLLSSLLASAKAFPSSHSIHIHHHLAPGRSQDLLPVHTLERRKDKKSVPRPGLSPQSQNDFYEDVSRYAAQSYCEHLDIGSKVGTDGTVLWREGDGSYNPRVYIAFSPTLGLVVGHEGTNKTSIVSIAFDIDFSAVSPRPGLQWLGPGVKINKGFQQAWNDTSNSVMMKMKEFTKQYPDAGIVTTGHSLGASTGLLSALELSHNFNVSVRFVGFGLPRVGNRKVS